MSKSSEPCYGTAVTFAKIGIVFASLLCFSLFLWFAVALLYLPFLPATNLFAYNYFYISPLPGLILPALGGVLYLRHGRPENPKPLYLFIAILLIAIAVSFLPGINTLLTLFFLGTLSPAILYLFLLVLPKTSFIRTLKIFSAIFAGIALVFGICIPAYFDAVKTAAAAAGGYPLAGETWPFIGIIFCLLFLTPAYGFTFLLGSFNALKSVPASQNSPQPEP